MTEGAERRAEVRSQISINNKKIGVISAELVCLWQRHSPTGFPLGLWKTNEMKTGHFDQREKSPPQKTFSFLFSPSKHSLVISTTLRGEKSPLENLFFFFFPDLKRNALKNYEIRSDQE